MQISFTSLGCPHWNLDTICLRAREYGFDGVDFRGYLGALDVTTLPEFTTGLAATQRRFTDAGLAVSGISSSLSICVAEKRHDWLEEARRTIPVALGLGAPNIRVFGGGDLKRYGRGQLADVGADCMQAILALDGAAQVRWHFETHDNWIAGRDCRMLLDRIPHPAFSALWDMGHTPRLAGERPKDTLAALGGRVGYTHIKDAVYEPEHPQSMGDGWRYVLPGTGKVPIGECVRLLRAAGYDGWLVFEHEKRWVPSLAEPEEAFPAYARWARSVLAA